MDEVRDTNILESNIIAPGQVLSNERKQVTDLGVKPIAADLERYTLQPDIVFKTNSQFSEVKEADQWPEPLKDQNFVVIQSTDREGNIVVYKARKKSDPRAQGPNEVAFYRNLAERLINKLPPPLQDKILLPKLIDTHSIVDDPEGRVSYILSFVKGEALGELRRVTSPNITFEDLQAIADFIRTMQIEGAAFLEPDDRRFMLTGENRVNMYERYAENINSRKSGFDVALGDEAQVYYSKLQAILGDEKTRELLATAPYVFTHGNINFADILKNEQGQLAILDFERVLASNNPAHDYAWLLTALRLQPELQTQFLNYIVDSNGTTLEERVRFKEHLRMSYLFTRGLGELKDWNDSLSKASKAGKAEEATLCKSILDAEVKFMKEAIDKTDDGIWSDKRIAERVIPQQQ